MPQPSAPRRSAVPELSVGAAPSRPAMPQLSVPRRSSTPQSTASSCAAPRRSAMSKPSGSANTAPRQSAMPRPSAPRRSSITPKPSGSAGMAPRQPAMPRPSAPRPSSITLKPSGSAGTAPRQPAMPQPSAPRRPATTPKPSASVCADPHLSAKPKPSAFPESALLDKVVYLGACCDNETTAKANTSDGETIQVSFLLAHPPALTRCFIYCPVLTVDYFFKAAPEILAADGAFLLIRVIFPHRSLKCRFDIADFFVYRSGPGTPSLELLQLPSHLYPLASLSNNVGVLSCGEHCLVVDLQLGAPAGSSHNLCVFSSKTKSWSKKLARLGCGMDRYRHFYFAAYKVFGVEGRSMAWVDDREGILLCSSVAEEPEVQLIQLPSLTFVNSIRFGETEIGTTPPVDSIRDVCCKDGWFRFIEIERQIGVSQLNDGSIKELNLGWKATMFKRKIHSDQWGWKQCGTLHSASISPADSCVPRLIGEKIWDYKKKKLDMNSVRTSFPTLDMCCNDVVDMLAKVKGTDPNGWVLSINKKSKKLQKIAPFSAKSPLISCIFLQCGFSKHFSGAPGVCTTNGWKDIKEDFMPLVPYITSSLLVQQKLRQLEKSFDEVKTLIHTGVSSTMNVHIHQVTQFATKNGLGKVASDAVDRFERASKDIRYMLSQNRRNGPLASAKAVREQIHVAVEALDKLMNMLPPSLLDTGRSMVSVECIDNESVGGGSISHNKSIRVPHIIY